MVGVSGVSAVTMASPWITSENLTIESMSSWSRPSAMACAAACAVAALSLMFIDGPESMAIVTLSLGSVNVSSGAWKASLSSLRFSSSG